ncbi:MAG: cupin domain-containing protein [Streptosporangiaceae bacterium]|nr:cupin domain-containing protein [Streptosporangiaceae bacterium]
MSRGLTGPAAPAVRTARAAPARPLAAGVTTAVLLGGRDGCRGLRQRRLRLTAGARFSAMAAGLGESWFVTGGAGSLETPESGAVPLREGVAVWLRRGTRYRCRADAGGALKVLATAVFAGSAGDDTGPATRVAALEDCEPEHTGDREFRVLLGSGPAGRLAITQFAGLIPPGRAPDHHHAYNEVVHVLAGRGVVHLGDADAAIGPGTSVYLPPFQPHCLENTGSELLRVLGVFHPAGSPAAKNPAT